MRRLLHAALAAVLAVPPAVAMADVAIEGRQIPLAPDMVSSDTDFHQFRNMVDEQDVGGYPPTTAPETTWSAPSQMGKQFPVSMTIDLGSERSLGRIMFYDLNGKGDIAVAAGEPGNWKELFVEDLGAYKRWKEHTVDVKTRYLQLTKATNGPGVSEILVYEHTEADLEKIAEQRRLDAEREAQLAKAKQEAANRPVVDTGTLFGELPLIEEILCGETAEGREFVELPEGASTVETILGKPMRVLTNEGGPKLFAYRMGKYKLMEPGKAYLLTVEFPEDQPRSFTVANRGSDMIKGVHTGSAVGDVLYTYTNNNLESLKIPMSGGMQTWQQLFFLNNHMAGMAQVRGKGERPDRPETGFYIIVSQSEEKNQPESAGAAVYRIRLFEVPDVEQHYAKLTLPPDGLPQRHLFFREEMADGVLSGDKEEDRAVTPKEEWFRQRAKIMNFLGMNTFSKDLLEFGAVQDWDAGSNAWYHTSPTPHVWGNVVKIAHEHGLNVLPMYEYAGSTGSQGIGPKKLAQPLSGTDYTHITWAEKRRADLTDPATLEDFKLVLDKTIIRYKDDAHFVGAWLRPRMAQLPIGFGDATRERFAKEANKGTAVSREELKGDDTLRERYYQWWYGKRRDFLVAVRDHLRSNGIDDAIVLMGSDPSEPGPSIRIRGGGKAVVTDDVEFWKQIATRPEHESLRPLPWDQVVQERLFFAALTSPTPTWGSWEWNHASPTRDPQTYKDTEGVLLTYTFNRLYTVANPEDMEAFRGPSGLAMIRHYPLNENTRGELNGYFVADYDRSGPYSMMAEARAVAHGDPWYLGYLAGHKFNRAFPEYARRFNQNFLALPALPSEVVQSASDDEEVVVRQIDTPSHGSWLAVVNTSLHPKEAVTLRLPRDGAVTDAVTGEALDTSSGSLTLPLYPGELRSLRIR